MPDQQTTEEQRRLMARPWERAEDHSIWEISGTHTGIGRAGRFENCLAMVVSEGGGPTDEGVTFHFIAPTMPARDRFVHSSTITHARPLLLVHRDQPDTALFPGQQHWIDHADHTGR